MLVWLSFFFQAQINHTWPIGSPCSPSCVSPEDEDLINWFSCSDQYKASPALRQRSGNRPSEIILRCRMPLTPSLHLSRCPVYLFSLSFVENKPLSCPKLQLVQTCVWAAVESSQGPSCADGTAGVLLAWLNYSELRHREGNPTLRLKGAQFFKGSDNIESRYRRTYCTLLWRNEAISISAQMNMGNLLDKNVIDILFMAEQSGVTC